MDEMLIQVSDDDSVILGPVSRKICHGNPAVVHRSVHVLVVNSRGALLLQKRSMRKDTQPGKWDTSVGGHVGFGQSYQEAARREAQEELGVVLGGDPAGGDPAGRLEFLYASRIRNAVESENIHTFLEISDGPFRAEPGEIDALRFWTRAEIEAALGTGVFTPNFEEEFALFLGSPRASLLK